MKLMLRRICSFLSPSGPFTVSLNTIVIRRVLAVSVQPFAPRRAHRLDAVESTACCTLTVAIDPLPRGAFISTPDFPLERSQTGVLLLAPLCYALEDVTATPSTTLSASRRVLIAT